MPSLRAGAVDGNARSSRRQQLGQDPDIDGARENRTRSNPHPAVVSEYLLRVTLHCSSPCSSPPTDIRSTRHPIGSGNSSTRPRSSATPLRSVRPSPNTATSSSAACSIPTVIAAARHEILTKYAILGEIDDRHPIDDAVAADGHARPTREPAGVLRERALGTPLSVGHRRRRPARGPRGAARRPGPELRLPVATLRPTDARGAASTATART